MEYDIFSPQSIKKVLKSQGHTFSPQSCERLPELLYDLLERYGRVWEGSPTHPPLTPKSQASDIFALNLPTLTFLMALSLPSFTPRTSSLFQSDTRALLKPFLTGVFEKENKSISDLASPLGRTVAMQLPLLSAWDDLDASNHDFNNLLIDISVAYKLSYKAVLDQDNDSILDYIAIYAKENLNDFLVWLSNHHPHVFTQTPHMFTQTLEASPNAKTALKLLERATLKESVQDLSSQKPQKTAPFHKM